VDDTVAGRTWPERSVVERVELSVRRQRTLIGRRVARARNSVALHSGVAAGSVGDVDAGPRGRRRSSDRSHPVDGLDRLGAVGDVALGDVHRGRR